MNSVQSPSVEQIETLRDLFLKRLEKENKDEGYHPNDIERVKTSNRWLQLFLEQCDLDMEQSLNMLRDTCRWRKIYEINDINENNINIDYLKSGMVFPHNKDVDGKYLLIFKTKLYTKGTRSDELISCVIYWVERLQNQTNYDQLSIVFDMQSCGLSNMDMDFTKRIIDTFKYYYPNSLNYVIIFDMPWILSAGYKIIKTLLPPKAVERMKFVNSKTMKEFITHDNMLQCWGGSDNYEFKFEPLCKPLQVSGFSMTSLSSIELNEMSEKVHFASSSLAESSLMSGQVDEFGDKANDVELIRITPDDSIFLKEIDNEFVGSVEIKNISLNHVTFKVKTTAPKKFRIRSSNGVLKPGQTTTIFVGLKCGVDISVSNKDKFLVMCMIIDADTSVNGQDISDLWKNASATNSNVEQHRLKCALPHTGNGIVNGCIQNFKTTEKQIIDYQVKLLSEQTEKIDKLQEKVKKSYRLLWITLLMYIFLIIIFAFIFKDDLFNTQRNCYRTN